MTLLSLAFNMAPIWSHDSHGFDGDCHSVCVEAISKKGSYAEVEPMKEEPLGLRDRAAQRSAESRSTATKLKDGKLGIFAISKANIKHTWNQIFEIPTATFPSTTIIPVSIINHWPREEPLKKSTQCVGKRSITYQTYNHTRLNRRHTAVRRPIHNDGAVDRKQSRAWLQPRPQGAIKDASSSSPRELFLCNIHDPLP
jgi:hypothetical protein